MAYGAAAAQSGFLVDDHPVLDVGAFSDDNFPAVSPDNGAVPDAYIFCKLHISQHPGIRGYVVFLFHRVSSFTSWVSMPGPKAMW